MANEIDILMDIDPLEMSAQDIDKIITYQRQHRANVEQGFKPKRETGPKQTLDLVAMGMVKPPEPIKRRI